MLHRGDEIVTFIARNLEPMRGYHIFMRALPAILAARPNAQVVLVGGDDVSYGAAPEQGKSWKSIYLDEVADRLDLSRVHFLPQQPYDRFVQLLQTTTVHVYLTFPFVLSWSMVEAMALGCVVVGSDTAPVREAITDGVDGLLTPFHDPAALAEKVTRILANPGDYAALGAAARQTALSRYDRKDCLREARRILGLEPASRLRRRSPSRSRRRNRPAFIVRRSRGASDATPAAEDVE